MSARASLRSLVLEIFPWMGRFGLTAKGDLAIKSATTKIELAGGDTPVKPVHRVDDLGSGGTFTISILPPGALLWTGPDGSSWAITGTVAGPGPVVFAIVPINPPVGGTPGKLITQATTGSERVRAG